MKEKKLRIEDALAATKAAVEEGIVAGGGIACMNAIPAVAEFVDTLEGDAKTGAKIVLKALEEPLRQIAATELAFWRAERVTFVGSTIPAETISVYSSVRALKP